MRPHLPGNLSRGVSRGPLTLWTQTRCGAETAERNAQRRSRAGRPARLCNAAIGVFGSNPKGTGVLGRHSVLLSLPRPLVLASSHALIGAPGHPFAYAPIALTDPTEGGSRPVVLVRVLLYIALAVVAGAFAMYVAKRDRRYLRFI